MQNGENNIHPSLISLKVNDEKAIIKLAVLHSVRREVLTT